MPHPLYDPAVYDKAAFKRQYARERAILEWQTITDTSSLDTRRKVWIAAFMHGYAFGSSVKVLLDEVPNIDT